MSHVRNIGDTVAAILKDAKAGRCAWGDASVAIAGAVATAIALLADEVAAQREAAREDMDNLRRDLRECVSSLCGTMRDIR